MKALILIAAIGSAFGQSPSFEVVSIKPAPPPEPGRGMRVFANGGPGSKDPGRWICENMSLSNLVSNAFELRPYQLTAPDWMNGERFNINAKIPEGATKEQFRQMMQNMLIERFGLQFHLDRKETQGYELVVGKNGPKFKESPPEAPKDPDAPPGAQPQFPQRPTLGADGFPVMPPGVSGSIMMNGKARSQWVRTPMENFAANMSFQAGKPVSDATGLKGKYDISLYWATSFGPPAPPPSGDAMPAASDPGGPNIFSALQEQLGLKLEPKKVTIEMLIVDHAEKSPSEN